MSKNAEADLELVEAIKNENKRTSEKAFEKLFQKYHESMLFRFKELVEGEEVAEELVMDAFVKVSTNIEKFNAENAAFSTWLFKMTQNLFIDRMRREKKEKEKIQFTSISRLSTLDKESNTVEYNIPSPETKTPEMEMLIAERNHKVNDAINSIENKELAMVLKMRYFEGMSYEEISEKTGKPLGTIKAFIFRAKEVLKQKLEKESVTL